MRMLPVDRPIDSTAGNMIGHLVHFGNEPLQGGGITAAHSGGAVCPLGRRAKASAPPVKGDIAHLSGKACRFSSGCIARSS